MPQKATFEQAEKIIVDWQSLARPKRTLVLLDQPTIVKNATGQRPVENLVGSSVSLRYGGMQPANTAKVEMFGKSAPVWNFLERFGGPADPTGPAVGTLVLETYPVLTIISLGWTLPHSSRPAGRLPKYNPERRRTFALADWRHVCRTTSAALSEHGLLELTRWAEGASEIPVPRKHHQDALDACICLLVGLHIDRSRECLLVGDQRTGYIVVPFDETLQEELQMRCTATERNRDEWVKRLRLH